MSDSELKELIAETFRGIKELRESQAKTDAQLAKTDAQQAKTDATVERIAKMVGGISNNQGDVTEEFFYNSLAQKMELMGVRFDYIEQNVKNRIKALQDEFDIVLYNGDTIILIETKYKLHPDDVKKVKTQKIPNFKTLFPTYANYKVYGGVAGFYIPEEAVVEAKKEGLLVLKRSGEVLEVEGCLPEAG